MRKIIKKNLPVFQFHLLQKFSDDVEHAITSKIGGASKGPFASLNLNFTVGDKAEDVVKNREILCTALGLEKQNVIGANQTHSKNILVVDEKFVQFQAQNEEVDNIDGFVTALKEIGLLIKVADCQAILIFDPVKKVIAAVHAGWKGQVQDISGEAIKIMVNDFGSRPENILVGISPSLGPCCAFFSDPAKELPPTFAPFILNEDRVDLWSYSLWQLEQHGILPENIELARVCSFCGGGEKFFSFRRDRGITGRFGALIFLK